MNLNFSKEALHLLVDLGLTRLQAKIFVGLIGAGKANAKKMSQITRVSRPDIYRTVSKLQELGLIEKEIAKPAVFRAIPMESAIEFLLSRKKIKHDELEVKSKLLIEKLKVNDKPYAATREEEKIILVPSQEALIKRLKKAVDNSQKSIDVATTFNRLNYACYVLSRHLEKAWNRNVKGRAIIELTEEKHTQFIQECWKNPAAEIRYTRYVPETVIAMYDKKEVFIFTKPSANLKDSPALWTDNAGIAAMVKDYFEILWVTAMKNPQYYLDST